ncbi:MAG: Gamma-glutamyltranspeptidase, partial [Gammaproteobacteria bacterium]
MAVKGVVAAGHPETARAAGAILEMGGNAFDAVLAAHLAACVAEPVLTSLGGGGFLLAQRDEEARLYDFFVQTPLERRPLEALDFHPIHADFGTATQAFHIGIGSIAVPGFIKGLFAIHEELCNLPLEVIMAPAIRLAREGVVVNALQAHAFQVVAPIYAQSPEALRLFGSPGHPGRLAQEGERL